MSDHDGSPADSPLKRTPLYAEHVALGARMVEFGGWEMPVQYAGGIIEEHRAVRNAAGIFDVSHMGEFSVTGAGALGFLQSLVPNNVAKLGEGQAQYTQICREDGGTLDDLLIYHLGPERYMVVVNAGTMEKDWDWFFRHAEGVTDLTLENRSMQTALLAVQGPRALEILGTLTTTDLGAMRYYWSAPGEVAGNACIISRTGYTGEDGFELYHDAEAAPALWQAILHAGVPFGLRPAGLGARDSLRLEGGFCLYDHELTEAISPLEADLGWSVKLKKGVDFIGRAALERQKTEGVPRLRVGLRLPDRAIARAGCAIWHEDAQVGALTSGTMSITLGYPIGMGFVLPALATLGTRLEVDVRGKRIPAEVVAMPFYHRPGNEEATQ